MLLMIYALHYGQLSQRFVCSPPFASLQGRLPEDGPNWHLNKLKPWKVPDAMALGTKHKRNAMSLKDPFQKVIMKDSRHSTWIQVWIL